MSIKNFFFLLFTPEPSLDTNLRSKFTRDERGEGRSPRRNPGVTLVKPGATLVNPGVTLVKPGVTLIKPEVIICKASNHIKGLKYLLCLSVFLCLPINAKKFTIMLSPEGDSTNPGRSLPEGFECGFTRQYAELLKETLEQDSAIRVILSHESGEQVSQYEKASFANRLEIDLYISINFYASEKPNVSVYYYKSALFEPRADATRIELYPTTKAYIFNNEKTQKIAQNWYGLEKHQTQMCINLPVALPIKQLEGITAPAFALDLSAQQIINIHMYIQPISNILTKVAHEQNN